jgi:hypothetical protein
MSLVIVPYLQELAKGSTITAASSMYFSTKALIGGIENV